MIDIVRLQRRLSGVNYRGAIDGVAGPLTWAALFRFAGAKGNAVELGEGAAAHFPAFCIDANPLRAAHFIAQTAHETGGYQWLTELWGPTPAQVRYEGRADLGNVQPGDGKRFMGRGLLQITGRANYAKAAKATALPLLEQPALASLPENALWTACLFWNDNRLNMLADVDDCQRITRTINGGLNGLADRAVRTAALKGVLL